MKSWLFLLTIIVNSFCDAEHFVCQLFDANSLSLETYCDWFNGVLPNRCLSDVHDVQPYQVNHLKIGGCSRFTVANLTVNHTNIRVLDISFSGHEHLEWFDFKFKQLQMLNASRNLLSHIPHRLLQYTPELVEIDLSFNKISKIESSDFENAEQLRKIHLSNNDLDHIDSEHFASIEYLEYVDLSRNHLKSIPTFPFNKQLKTIHIEENPINAFNCSFMLSIGDSVSVFLSWKSVRFFNGESSCNDQRFYVIPSSQHEGVLKMSDGMQKMLCNKNSFSSLNRFIAGQNAFENIVDVLKCFTDIDTINLSGNFIGELNTTAFKQFYFLEHLNVSDTQLTSFDAHILQSPLKMKSLDLSGNHLKNVHGISLLNFLKEFNINGNGLQNTPQIIHNLAASVQNLDLSNNFVGNLNALTFKRLPILKRLRLSNTSLSFSHKDPFKHLNLLSSLDISYNNLTSVNFTILSKTLNRLDEFIAVGCQITNISNIIQHFGPLTKKLDLSKNSIGLLNGQAFERLHNLQELILINTQMSQLISLNALPNQLKRINLEGNDLTKLDHFNRSHFIKVESLGISKNKLSCKILDRIVDEFKEVQFIGNPFEQTHGLSCRFNTGGVIIGVVILTTILFIILCLCVMIWNQFIKPFQSISMVH